MWIFKQKTGDLYRNDRHIAVGYAGFGDGKNNPLAQHIHGVGPLPQGAYWIGEPADDPHLGKYVLRLTPVTGTQLFGRGGFAVHGFNALHPADSSHGCPVFELPHRKLIHESGDALFVVLSGTGPWSLEIA